MADSAASAEGWGSTPDQGAGVLHAATKTLHAATETWCGQVNKTDEKPHVCLIPKVTFLLGVTFYLRHKFIYKPI